MNKKNIFIFLSVISTYLHSNSNIDLSQEPYKTIAEKAVTKFKYKIEDQMTDDCSCLKSYLAKLISALTIIQSKTIREEDKASYFEGTGRALVFLLNMDDSGFPFYRVKYDSKKFECAFSEAINGALSEINSLQCPN